MYNLAINPYSGNLQVVDRNPIYSICVSEDTYCKGNRIYICNNIVNTNFFLPIKENQGSWIKIFGKSEGGWSLQIPKESKVISHSGMRVIDHNHYFHSNMHQFDFIHVIYIGDSWYIENKSQTIGISKHE